MTKENNLETPSFVDKSCKIICIRKTGVCRGYQICVLELKLPVSRCWLHFHYKKKKKKEKEKEKKKN